MYRNLYDTDVTLWSPEGRLHQVEYAMEAVKQGSACVGIRCKDGVVLAGLKRRPNELASYQEKVFRIDDHVGVGISGLTADAGLLMKWMRTECLNHRFVYESPLETSRMVIDMADKHQKCTQSYVRRPYGVGLLIASFDKGTGAHLFETQPSGNYFEYKSIAIGARCQAAKTYLERFFERKDVDSVATCAFDDMNIDDCVQHALRALGKCVQGDDKLDKDNVSVGVVGKDRPFERLQQEDVAAVLTSIEEDAGPTAGAGAGGMDEEQEEAAESKHA